jgi:hypothetical protein
MERMLEERTVKKVFKNIPERKCPLESHERNGWTLDDVENDAKKISVRGWRKMDRNRDAWKLILKEAKVLHGPRSQWRRRRRPALGGLFPAMFQKSYSIFSDSLHKLCENRLLEPILTTEGK